MAREGQKVQKRTYVAPKTRNVVSKRTIVAGIRPGVSYDGRPKEYAAAAGAMARSNSLLDNYVNGQAEPTRERNYQRINKAVGNMLRRIGLRS